jgi:hypothetical protein
MFHESLYKPFITGKWPLLSPPCTEAQQQQHAAQQSPSWRRALHQGSPWAMQLIIPELLGNYGNHLGNSSVIFMLLDVIRCY